MNWEEVGAIGQVLGSIAVFVTLVYLTIQVWHANRQALLVSFQHNTDKHAEFISQVVSSESLAEIIVRARASYASLKSDEQLRFDLIHALIMNIIENSYFQVIKTSDTGPYRDAQLGNLREMLRKFCDHPGFMQFWVGYSSLYPPRGARVSGENISYAIPNHQAEGMQ